MFVTNTSSSIKRANCDYRFYKMVFEESLPENHLLNYYRVALSAKMTFRPGALIPDE